ANTDYLRILRLLSEDSRSRHLAPLFGFDQLKDAPWLPSRAALEAFLIKLYRDELRRAPWLMAYDFARELLPEGAHRDDVAVASESTDVVQTRLGRARRNLLPFFPPSDEGSRYRSEVRLRELNRRLDEQPLTIFIDDETQQEAVQSAVAEWLTAQGLEISWEGDPIIGSFWRTFLTRFRKGAEDHLDEGMALAGRAVGLYGLDTRQAEVNQKEAEAFAKVMEALATVDSAIIHHGTLLVVKHAGTVVRRELSQLEVEALRKNPVLTARPDIILQELQRHTEELAIEVEAEASPTQHTSI
ncbi:hypothetical protein ACWCSD_34535, partial [Nonomuraea sp. NPDC001684]